MLDQEDFENINTYVKRYGLIDRSMAEQRKARLLHINSKKDKGGKVVASVEFSELSKANLDGEMTDVDTGHGSTEQRDDEDEDEDEEDYDPGSEGESEGSGSSSDDEIGLDDYQEETDNDDANSL